MFIPEQIDLNGDEPPPTFFYRVAGAFRRNPIFQIGKIDPELIKALYQQAAKVFNSPLKNKYDSNKGNYFRYSYSREFIKFKSTPKRDGPFPEFEETVREVYNILNRLAGELKKALVKIPYKHTYMTKSVRGKELVLIKYNPVSWQGYSPLKRFFTEEGQRVGPHNHDRSSLHLRPTTEEELKNEKKSEDDLELLIDKEWDKVKIQNDNVLFIPGDRLCRSRDIKAPSHRVALPPKDKNVTRYAAVFLFN